MKRKQMVIASREFDEFVAALGKALADGWIVVPITVNVRMTAYGEYSRSDAFLVIVEKVADEA